MSKTLTPKTIKPWKCKDINITDVFGEDEVLPSVRRFLIKDIPPCPNGFQPTEDDMIITVLVHSTETFDFFKNNRADLLKIFPEDSHLLRILELENDGELFDNLLGGFIIKNKGTDAFSKDLRRLMLRLWV